MKVWFLLLLLVAWPIFLISQNMIGFYSLMMPPSLYQSFGCVPVSHSVLVSADFDHVVYEQQKVMKLRVLPDVSVCIKWHQQEPLLHRLFYNNKWCSFHVEKCTCSDVSGLYQLLREISVPFELSVYQLVSNCVCVMFNAKQVLGFQSIVG